MFLTVDAVERHMRVAARSGARQPLLAALVAVLTFGGILLQGSAPSVTRAASPAAQPCTQRLFATERVAGTENCAAAEAASEPVISGELPPGFLESVVWSGLFQPTAIRFAADGRVFVAEKSGLIKVFHNLADTTPTVFSDLPPNVHDFWDRGFVGMALDPSMTGGSGSGSYLYVAYTYDHVLGSSSAAPRWSDDCPAQPGPLTDGCVVSGRVSRFAVSGDSITGSEQVLIEDWCQQFPSHSVDSLAFGPDGYLYVSGGDGASFKAVDYGQLGGTTTPVVTGKNPCGDPPGGAMSLPTAAGGALRSQSPRIASYTQKTLDGTILRVNPATGAGVAGNPYAASSDANAKRIIAYGLRNPFRMTFRPGTNELWLGDVGWNAWEEINRITNVTDGVARNFAWPCYEGNFLQSGYDGANIDECENLYAQGNGPTVITGPYYGYHHATKVLSDDDCSVDAGSSTTGLAFYPESGGSYPAAYKGGLFYADHTRNCIWFMPKGSNGLPDSGARIQFLGKAANPVDLVIGPGGDLFYVDFDGGTIRRISPNASPVAIIDADPTSGAAPLHVDFDASRSTDPEGGGLTYAWDLDGDGQYDDATGVTTSRTYNASGDVTVGLKVTDNEPSSGTTSKVIHVGNEPPIPVIASPSSSLKWKVGDLISFSGSATDPQDGSVPASKLTWTVTLMHCPDLCHPHSLKTVNGAASGSFTAPDHEYPSWVELKLTATDSQGLSATATRRLDPRTVVLTFASAPAGMSLVLNSSTVTAPVSPTVIVGSSNQVTATSPQTRSGLARTFASWSDGLGQTHSIVAPTSNATFTATYRTTIPAKADAYVAAAHKGTNYGASSVLKVKSDVYRSYVKFAVTGLTKPASSAKLRLWVTNPSTSAGSVYLVSNSWTQSTITWNNAPPIGSSPRLALLGTTKTGTWVEINVTSAIKGNGSFSFRISGGSTNQAEYATRETSHDPVLIVTP